MQAIIKVGSSQYLVSVGQEVLVDNPESASILAVLDGDKVTVGQPLVAGATVVYKVVREERGPKLRVAKYKAKSRYRKVRGFRAEYSRIKIEDIYIGDKKTEEAPVKKTRSTKAKAKS
jgi:large subunit ribosomal protein L21